MATAERKWHLRIVQFRPGTTVDDAVRSIERLTEIAADPDLGLEARIFAIPPSPSTPEWAAFIEEAAAGEIPQLRNQFSGAVILATYGDRLWGLTFGLGHVYINDDVLESRFGLRTVANLVDPKRLLSVGSRVHDDLIMRTIRQASRSASRGVFTIDDTRDIVGAVTGEPRDKDLWGGRLSGSSALALTVPASPASLRRLLERVDEAHRRDDYKREFGFIDFIEPVRDPDLLVQLDADLVAAVRGDINSDVYLAPPEIVEYEDVRGFLFPREQVGTEHSELDLEDYRRTIDEDDISLRELHRQGIRLVAESTGSERRRWSVYKCLVHETTIDGRPYLLSEGEWFAVEASFVERVNRDIADIEIVDLNLPDAWEGEKEGDWNARAAAECNYALLDKREVRFGGTDMEVADLLTASGELVHVKRKTQSATLSHLINQGRVSAEALKVDGGVRSAAATRLDEIGRAEASLFRQPFNPASHKVVYAVIAKNAAELPGKLPFFSRLNLWHAHRFLTSTLDYRVGFTGIPLIPKPPAPGP